MSNNPDEVSQSRFLVSVLMICLFTCSCSQSRKALVESVPAYQPTPDTTQIRMPSIATPKLSEVQAAVQRVFKDRVVIDTTTRPSFFTGDFNGDTSQDLAVILKPAPGKLAEMNEEFPAWLLRDPSLSDLSTRSSLSVDERDVLLAIIHGYGANDWRDQEATQTFLLKNAVGSNLTVQTAKDFLTAHSGRNLPRPKGDLIGETLRGNNVYLYYSSANYFWYDPKTFKVSSDIGMVHGGR